MMLHLVEMSFGSLGTSGFNVFPQPTKLSLRDYISQERECLSESHFIGHESSADFPRRFHLPINTVGLILVQCSVQACECDSLIDSRVERIGLEHTAAFYPSVGLLTWYYLTQLFHFQEILQTKWLLAL
jgi:hypothetical protein